MGDRLFHRIEDARDDLVALTQALIAIPTLNPPGENYAAICDFLDNRLAGSGFETTWVRAEGAPGDSDR
jgi:succinyl-diaminopimelate desuccinylase